MFKIKIIRIVLVLAITSFLIAGCKKKEAAPPFVSYLKLDIDGTTAENDRYINASGYRTPPHLIGIAANLKPYIFNKNSIEWEIYDFMEAPGEYAIPGPVGTIRYITLFQPEATFVAKAGKITILEVDKNYIKGTFEFITHIDQYTGIQKTITNGQFHIKRSL